MIGERTWFLLMSAWMVVSSAGCQWLCHDKYRPPHITARPASPNNQCSPPGIPFYLPKPILVISKNFYHVEEAKVGLTGSAPIPGDFASQAEYADVALNAEFTRSGQSEMNSDGSMPQGQSDNADGNGDGEQTSNIAHSPTLHSKSIPSAPQSGAIPSDGLGPHTFFTYEILFVPDLTEKYVLEVNGSPGEIRAAMNLVNGWQFTGLGPYYMKDSSTAQNVMARGVALNLGLGGAADVVNSVANLKSLAGSAKAVDASALAEMAAAMEEAKKTTVFDVTALKDMWIKKKVVYEDGTEETVMVPPTLERYAEIYAYEAVNEGGLMVWKPIANHVFDRQYLGILKEGRLAGGEGAAVDPNFGAEPAAQSEGTLQEEELPTGPADNPSAFSEPFTTNDSLLSLAAQQAILDNAMQAAGYDPVPAEMQDRIVGGARAFSDNGTSLSIAQPMYAPRSAAAHAAPPTIISPEVTAQAVQGALSPALLPHRTPWYNKLLPCNSGTQRTSQVNALVGP